MAPTRILCRPPPILSHLDQGERRRRLPTMPQMSVPTEKKHTIIESSHQRFCYLLLQHSSEADTIIMTPSSSWPRPSSVLGILRIFLVSSILVTVHPFTSQNIGTMSRSIPRRSDGKTSCSPFSSRHAVTLGKDATFCDPYEMANNIEPETKPLPKSMAFYARFVVNYLLQNRLDKKSKEKVKGRRRAMLKKLDEQRRNIMTLAGYTSHIVVPSFLFLFLGALMTSVVPSYYSKCIQCVATLSATRGELIHAFVGLSVSSILAALFTGLRGALFWIGGK